MAVVVVESPAKAKTINKYLGPGYTVLASYGHVRDLPPKDGSVDPDAAFSMTWEVSSDSRKHVKAIADALAHDDKLILATDPDREGEAISWHLQEALKKRRAIKKDTAVSRVVFNAVTKSAVTEAMKNPRQIDMELVEAYLARRALDYLVGFKLSPVLWRRLPGAKSAGRVQSVCLRLVVEREMEIEAFRPREFWGVRAMLRAQDGQTYDARLVTLGGQKLEKFSIETHAQAELAVQAVTSRALTVREVEAKPASRKPAPPFMTSTLQQEASRKFGFGARQTMSLAQRLYEAGHITYMRTDGIDMAPEAVHAARATIAGRFGPNYVPSSPRMYKNKAKNAQEAHECIRPTEINKSAREIHVPEDQRKLYDLIWKRTVASQMEVARMERTVVEIGSDDAQVGLRATGQVILFDGFLKIYEESRDEDQGNQENRRLPRVAVGDAAPLVAGGHEAAFAKATAERDARGTTKYVGTDRRVSSSAVLSGEGAVLALQSFTQPPPRYTEATLIKRMEELGIGRPSTYASIITTIQDREYVRKDKGRLFPEDKGRLVTAFLTNFFRRYVGYQFTAELEDELDDVSAGTQAYLAVLEGFWGDFKIAINDAMERSITEVLEKINEDLAPHLFPPSQDGGDPRLCPRCGNGRLSMRTARAGGAFIGCSNYPECRYVRAFGPPGAEDASAIAGDDKLLGLDNGEPITLRDGRFGPYVQRGDVSEAVKKPPRQSIPKGWDVADIDLQKALMLLSLPRAVGLHPDDGEMIEASIGRYGPYVRHGRLYANIDDVDEVFSVGMNRAVELLAEKAASRGRGRATANVLHELGEHPEGGPVAVMDGRYGPYVKWGKINATIPKGAAPAEITIAQALELLSVRAAKAGKKKTTTRKKTTASKRTTKRVAK